MKLRTWLGLIALASLGLTAAGLATRVAEQLAWDFEPGGVRLATLSDATRAKLATFDEELVLSYYVSPREQLPSHLAHLEDDVRSGLEAVASGVKGPVRVHVLSPEAHPELVPSLASAGVAPWRARRIERDGYREDVLWSSLRINYGARPGVVVNGVGPEEARNVQGLVLAHLEQLRAPRRPRVAISAPPGFDRLRSILATGAELLELDFAANPEALPEDVDLFFWLGGAEAGPRQLARLDALRERGGSAVLSVESLATREDWAGDQVSAEFARVEAWQLGARALLLHTGLAPREGLLLDPRGAEVVGPEGQARVAPWRVRATPDNQDFRSLAGQPNAPLYFAAPTPLQLEPSRLAELGFEATVLATASSGASLHELPQAALSLAAASELTGTPAPRAALVVRLVSDDPWRGSRIVLADSSPLADADFDGDLFGHGAFLRVLLEALTSDERMVRTRVAATQPAPLEQLADSTRLMVRLAVLGFAPLLLLVHWVLRGGRGRAGSAATRGRTRFLLLRGVPAAALVVLIAAGARGLDLDLTRDASHRLTSAEASCLQGYVDSIDAGVLLEVAFSDDDRLPAEHRPLAREVRRACAELARELDGLRLERLVPERAGEGELRARGLKRLALTSVADEVTTVRRVFASVVVSSPAGREVLDFPTVASFGELRFRLAFALARLARGRPTRIAMLAEPPRLSPAEAALEYQRKGLFAPREAGVFGEFEALLARNDFEVLRVDSPTAALPVGTDVVLLLQPRRDVRPSLATLSSFLAEGGRALLSAQHYRVLARQLERQDLELAFWPRPQFCDLETHYLPELGLTLVRDLVFDQPAGSLAVETRIDREDGTSAYESQESTQPFFVQVALDAEVAPLFAGVGEVLLPFASRIEFDTKALAARGLTAEVLAATSSRAWSYTWQGGDLPAAALDGDAPSDELVLPAPHSPLCVRIEGTFPRASLEATGEGEARLVMDAEPEGAGGRLLLLGNSEVFRDELLTLDGFAHDAFALRCVASLALEPQLAAFLRRERSAAGLGPTTDAQRRGWRLLVIAAFPLALALLGLWRRRVA